MTFNHSLKFFSGLSSEESCIDNKKRKLVLKANTGLGLREFDKEDIYESQRIWCRVPSEEKDEVFHRILTVHLGFCAFNQAAPGIAYKQCKIS